MTTDEQSPLIAHNGMSTIGSNGQDLGQQTSPGPQKLNQQQLWLTIGFPYVGLLLVAMDVTLVSTLSASMASQFSSLSLVSWLGSSYLIATAATQPLIGRLSDLYGRRLNLFASTFLFTLGNVLCGVSNFMAVGGVPLLITGRIIAGAGGGAMNAIAAFIATDLVPLDRRAVWTGIADVIWAAGIGVGGVVGGAVHDWVGWPWAFFGFVPLSLLVLVGVYFTLPPADHHRGRDDSDDNSRIDYPGAASLVSAIVCLTLGLNLAEQGDYIPPLSWTLLAVSTVLFVCFAIVEFSPHATHNPFIPILLLRDRTVAMVCASAVLVAASMHSLLYYVPFWIQVRGYSASQVGVQMLGELVGASLGSLTTGLLIKRLGGYGFVKPVVFLVFTVAPLSFAMSNLDTPVWATVLPLIAMGAGFGSILTVILIALLATIQYNHDNMQTTCTSMLYTFRQTGAAAGLSVAGIIFRSRFSQLAKHISDDDNDVSGEHRGLRNVVELCKEGASVLHHLTDHPQELGPDVGRPEVCIAYGEALHSVFVYSTTVAVACLVCGLLVRNVQVSRLAT